MKLNNPNPFHKVKEGKSYPRIISELLGHHEALASPNNILGISYLKAIAKHAKTSMQFLLNEKMLNIMIH